MDKEQLKQIIIKTISGVESRINSLSERIDFVEQSAPSFDLLLEKLEVRVPKYGKDWKLSEEDISQIIQRIKPVAGIDYIVKDGKDAVVTDELINKIIKIVQSKIKNGADGKDGEDGIDGLDGSPDTPKEIAVKLNTLSNVIDWKVLKDFNSLVNQDTLKRAIETLENQTRFLIQRQSTSTTGVSSLSALTGAVTLSAGTGITLNIVGNDIEIENTGSGGTPATPQYGVQYNNPLGTFDADTLFTRNPATGEFSAAGALTADPFVISAVSVGTFYGGAVPGAGLTHDDPTSGGYANILASDGTVPLGEPMVAVMETADGGNEVSTVLSIPTAVSMSQVGAVFSGSVGVTATRGVVVDEYSFFSSAIHDLLEFQSSVSGENLFIGTNYPTALGTGVFNWMGGGTAAPLTSGSFNTTWGYGAGASISTGSRNTLIGTGTGNALSNGVDNVFIGNNVGLISTGATQSVIIGSNAGNATGNAIDNIVAIGYLSGQNITDAGVYNTLVGSESGRRITSGVGNAILGGAAGQFITTGGQNVIIGNLAGQAITTDNDNVVIGSGSGRDGVSSFARATFVGRSAGEDNTSSDSTFVGYQAGRLHTSGDYNTVVGSNAYSGATTGDHNTIMGADSATVLGTGMDNVIIGATSAQNLVNKNSNVIIGNDALQASTTGASNVFIGDDVATATTTAGDLNVIIGRNATLANSVNSSIGLGGEVDVTASNQFVVGSATAPINDYYFGEGVTSTTPSAITFNATGGSGTDIAGADYSVAAGRPTGSGTPGEFLIKTAPTGASGTTLRTLETAAKFDATTTAGNTRFFVYDVDNGTLERVTVGAADSGGTGYKLLRIAN